MGIPAWQREGPLVYSDGRLICVPGLGIDARVAAQAGEPRMQREWIAGSGPAAGAGAGEWPRKAGRRGWLPRRRGGEGAG